MNRLDEPTNLAAIRRDVASLVQEWLADGRFSPSCDAWLRHYDLDFTRALAERGLIGVTWPKAFGGRELSGAARLIITEELLRHGAPVAAHWIADRQLGPSILQHGSDTARQRYLPGIAAGTVTFCLGMSEPGSGSDLASVATKAVRTASGWEITGQKIWTSQGHRSTHAYVLARTSTGDDKHDGLSEFIVDMSSPGVTVRPIRDLRGEHHFNEIFFDGVPVADDDVIGVIGNGWDQVTAQLAHERGGIERVLSTYPLFATAVAAVSAQDSADAGDLRLIGRTAARYATLRAMAFDITRANDAGRAPVVEAAMLKDLGTALEREVNEVARTLLDQETDPTEGAGTELLAQGIQAAPGFTIRGGTTEVLRTIISKSVKPRRRGGDDLSRIADDVLDGTGGEPGDMNEAWENIQSLGWAGVSILEERGGAGGTFSDLATIVTALGRHNVSLPLGETVVAGRHLAAEHHLTEDAISTVALLGPGDTASLADGRLKGRVRRVPWGRLADTVLVEARGSHGPVLVALQANGDGVRWSGGVNLAGEPRDDLDVDCSVEDAAVLSVDPGVVRNELAVLRAAAIHGALERTLEHAAEHVRTREQFGRPLIAFQAVGALLATLASEVRSTGISVARAAAAIDAGPASRDAAWTRVAAARVTTGHAATEGTRIAHQLLAAMGVTREHPLHLSTRRAWSWRDEIGTERSWTERLGAHVAQASADEIWCWITEQTDDEEGQ